jgi:hypothetical protein
MHDPHKNPNYIFTNCLHISHVFLSHEDSQVTLLGCYNDMLDDGMRTISIETDFATLNDLLAEYGPEADDTIEQIATLLSHPTKEDPMIDLCDERGLSFSGFIFAFMMIMDTDEEGNPRELGEYNYLLTAYVKTENIFPEFCSYVPLADGAERVAYLNSLLAMQYHVYLSCQKKLDQRTALIYSNLTDPLCFTLAQTQYDLQKSGQAN